MNSNGILCTSNGERVPYISPIRCGTGIPTGEGTAKVLTIWNQWGAQLPALRIILDHLFEHLLLQIMDAPETMARMVLHSMGPRELHFLFHSLGQYVPVVERFRHHPMVRKILAEGDHDLTLSHLDGEERPAVSIEDAVLLDVMDVGSHRTFAAQSWLTWSLLQLLTVGPPA